MNDVELELLLYRILTAKTYFVYNDTEYCLISPSTGIRYKALRLYNSIIQEEKYQNWIREENLTKVMILLGVWDNNTDEVLQGLEKSLDKMKLELYKAFMFPSKQMPIRKNIENIRKNLTKILMIKQEYMSHTLEGYANSLKPSIQYVKPCIKITSWFLMGGLKIITLRILFSIVLSKK